MSKQSFGAYALPLEEITVALKTTNESEKTVTINRLESVISMLKKGKISGVIQNEPGSLEESNKKLKAEARALRAEKKDALLFSSNVYLFISWMDAEMKKPSTNDRDKRVAKAINELEMCADRFSHFTLKQSFGAISKMKNKVEN